MNDPNLEIAQKLQERFEFYLIALEFTILGLSIQTASFAGNLIPDIFELSAWCSLLASGLIGLSRLEWIPVSYKYHVEIGEIKAELEGLRQALQLGQTEVPVVDDERGNLPIAEVISFKEGIVSRHEPKAEKIDRWTLLKWQIHKWLFVLGLFLLMASRSFLPIQGIIGAISGVST